ncbi:MAG: DUF4143 domain-containing protein, partial [Bacteroidaceae bacterium]|nr:DUF4143 domain-containing protein [Bacteroidaceae bacterium]
FVAHFYTAIYTCGATFHPHRRMNGTCPLFMYYRDRYGLEADVVLHLDDGRYALIECKLGSNEIEEGSSHLIQLHNLIKEHNKTERQMPIREPDLKIVLTGGKYGYTRNDGVHVIPLACLRP